MRAFNRSGSVVLISGCPFERSVCDVTFCGLIRVEFACLCMVRMKLLIIVRL